jgi:DNA polymerase III epsilon subunit-like protein
VLLAGAHGLVLGLDDVAVDADGLAADELSDVVSSFVSDGHLVVGFNLIFDLKFLLCEEIISQPPQITFDVMREYARVHPRRSGRGSRGWVRLEDVAHHYGIAFSPHNALEDARATAGCFRALLGDKSYVHAVQAQQGRER